MSTEPKPIAVIYYLPDGLNDISMATMNEVMANKMPDYHVFAVPSRMSIEGDCEDIRLQVFHPKDFTPIQFEELKKMITEAVEELKSKPQL